jgi:uncharacterized protein YbjT (DUF2867 family)
MQSRNNTILLTGATGFLGRRLLTALTDQGYQVRCLVRSLTRFRRLFPDLDVEIVQGDLLQPQSLETAFHGVDTAYYLIHSMGDTTGGPGDFAEKDRRAAANFASHAQDANLNRIIYMGGLGETTERLSKHLRSRLEVAQILKSRRVPVTTLRAAVIIGKDSASFEMIRYLVERLPVMTCPKWVFTRCQPIAVKNVIDYLLGCLQAPETVGRSLDICGPDIVSYRELMLLYARARGLHRVILPVPVLSPRLSSYWVEMLTPVAGGIVRPLIEGLKNEVVCQDTSIRSMIPVELMPMDEAIRQALAESGSQHA